MVIVSISSEQIFSIRELFEAVPKAARCLVAPKTRLDTPIPTRVNGTNLENPGLFYDGSAMIIINGVVVAQGSQFSLRDVEVVTGTYS
jgi:hypothetical protein